MFRDKLPLAASVVACVAAFVVAGRSASAGEVQSLSPQKDISEHWVPEVAPPDTWSVKEGVIICKGQPHGYIRTKKEYANYVFKFEWRYEPEGAPPDPNSGVLLNIAEPHKTWPKCIEVQLMNPDAGSIFPLEGGIVEGAIKKLQGKAKPMGEWNSYLITVRDGQLSLVFNGELVNQGTGLEPRRGTIALQSEGWEIHFRNISIEDLGEEKQ
jgi:hypothetical protein